MSRSVTIREFAEELHISERLAYGMARCEDFQRLGISFDVGMKRPGKKKRHVADGFRPVLRSQGKAADMKDAIPQDRTLRIGRAQERRPPWPVRH